MYNEEDPLFSEFWMKFPELTKEEAEELYCKFVEHAIDQLSKPLSPIALMAIAHSPATMNSRPEDEL